MWLLTGKQGVRWSFLLNVPYVVIPIVSAVRFLRQQDSQPDRTDKSLLVTIYRSLLVLVYVLMVTVMPVVCVLFHR